MINILIIQNGYCRSSIDEIINKIYSNNKIKRKIEIIKSYDNIKYDTIDFIKKWDKIIILGGYQSVRELDRYPYLKKVIELIKISVSLNIPLLGICLGCQLIAKAYNNQIIKMDSSKIGYISKLRITNYGKDDNIFNYCDNLTNILSFHVDTFDIKKNNPIKVLANYNYKNKIYPYIIKNGSAYGVQFHPEVNIDILKSYLNLKYNILLNKKKMEEILKYAEENNRIITKTGEDLIKKWLI